MLKRISTFFLNIWALFTSLELRFLQWIEDRASARRRRIQNFVLKRFAPTEDVRNDLEVIRAGEEEAREKKARIDTTLAAETGTSLPPLGPSGPSQTDGGVEHGANKCSRELRLFIEEWAEAKVEYERADDYVWTMMEIGRIATSIRGFGAEVGLPKKRGRPSAKAFAEKLKVYLERDDVRRAFMVFGACIASVQRISPEKFAPDGRRVRQAPVFQGYMFRK